MVLLDSDESSSSAEETIVEVAYYTSEFESEFEFETSEYYDIFTNYGLFMNNDDDQEIFHDAIESASENFIENHIDSQKDYNKSEVDHNDYKEKEHLVDKLIHKFNHKIAKCQKRIEKANQQSKDLENQNKDLQEKYDVLINQVNTFEEQNNKFNEQIKVLNKKNADLLAQMEVLQDQVKVKHVVIDTYTECQAQYAKLEEERYEYMIRYSTLCDNDKQNRKKIDEQEILFDKMSRFENPSYFEKAKDLRPSLYDEKVIGLGHWVTRSRWTTITGLRAWPGGARVGTTITGLRARPGGARAGTTMTRLRAWLGGAKAGTTITGLQYMPPEDDVFPVEEQSLPVAATPTADSPRYNLKFDPNEDPKEDEEEDPEEDPTNYPTDSTVVALPDVDHVLSEEVTEPLPQIPSPPLPIPSPPPDSPTHIEISESCLPLRKRLRFASPTPSQEVGESSTAGAARQNEPTIARDDPYSLQGKSFMDLSIGVTNLSTIVEQETTIMYGMMEEAQDDRSQLRGRVNLLYRDRPVHRHLVVMIEIEAKMALAQHALVLDLQAADRRRQGAIKELLAADHKRQVQLIKALSLLSIMGYSQLADCIDLLFCLATQYRSFVQAMIDQGVTAALAAHNATSNGDDSHTSGTGRPVQVKGTDVVAYSQRFQELALMCDRTFLEEIDKVERYVDGLPDTIHSSVMATKPKTMQDAIEFTTELMNKKINTWAERQDDNKRKSNDTTQNNHHNQTRDKTLEELMLQGMVTREHTKGLDLSVPNGHFKRECPKLKNSNNWGNQVGNAKTQAKVYAVGKAGANPDNNVVTGTFLLNKHYAYILFDTSADRSFVSTTFSSRIIITLTALDHEYNVELADGRIVGLNTIIRCCTLNFLNHPFNIDRIPIELGSFDVIIGMDWLVKYHAVIICAEKIVCIPFGDELLIVRDDESSNKQRTRLNIISYTKTQEYITKGCHVFLANITATKDEDKSKGKRLEDLPVV
uniref:Reverse transcriptase domain-containing protein n=1 Tax=Tanacetum cinerariifolium TaxID=118510 RepID=A0A6L2MSG6_TANCI|nr:hypothetical protein [Tanacetum cinerariifolium]